MYKVNTMYVDTHIHLYNNAYTEDLEEVCGRARAAGVHILFLPAIDLTSIEQAAGLSRRLKGVYAMAGIHPSETANASESDMQRVSRWCGDESVVAIGETGLDYHRDRSFIDRQKYFLRKHAELAIETGLPLILHNRKADGDLVDIIREAGNTASGSELRGIFHCFQGNEEFAREILDLGFLIGIGGSLTFRNSDLRSVVRNLPLEGMVLETDGPYLAPVPYRGKRNEPSYIPLVAQELSEAMEIPLEEVAEVTTRNARELFGV